MKRHDDRKRSARHVTRVFRMLLVAWLGLGLLGTAIGQVTPEGYARPELLAETDWLVQQLNAPQLRKMYEAVGITRDKAIITYCQTGVRAAHALFTLRLLGYNRVRNYDGSWQEWGNRPDVPIAR